MNKLEISVCNKEEAIIAERGGADRLELAIMSEKGGLTPTMHQISEVLSVTSLPSYILIRPRLDSYNLSEQEFKEVLHLVGVANLSTAKGISVGLLKDGKIDREKLEKIIAMKGDLEIVFNHAIDSVYDYETELEYLINNDGIDYIQTSGSAETIFDGYKRILPFQDKLKDKLILGRSINPDNINQLIENGFDGVVFQCKSSLVNEHDENNVQLSLSKVEEFSKILKGGTNE